jgi:branched-subunit amino acid aminotransferase/4-amino-4-deoxychorismate lyase
MTIQLKSITKENFFLNLGPETKPWHSDYLIMYSSWFGGYVADPNLMLIPVDDHLAHRGDGVFDVIRCINGRIYQMEAHLKRLERSAKTVSLAFPPEYGNIREIITALINKGGEKDCIIRVVISRGPGGFSTNPFECPSSQLYINIIRFHRLPDADYVDGVSAITSKIPIKNPFFAVIKSCNYLPNVLMKIEAANTGCRHAVNIDEQGFIGEGSTESICVVSNDGYIKIPEFENTLAGTTAGRVFSLSNKLVMDGHIKGVQFAKLTLEDLYLSSELIMMGTSINLVPVVRFDGKVIGKGVPGPIYSRLSDLLWKDMTENKELLTDVYLT